MIPKCSCTCICKQKLLTRTSLSRNRCSGCFLGNCKGERFQIQRTYIGGRFEIIKTGQYSIMGNKSIKDAYPQTLDETKSTFEYVWNEVKGEYEKKTSEKRDA